MPIKYDSGSTNNELEHAALLHYIDQIKMQHETSSLKSIFIPMHQISHSNYYGVKPTSVRNEFMQDTKKCLS